MKRRSLGLSCATACLVLSLLVPRAHADDTLYRALGERRGLDKIVGDAVALWTTDDRIKDQFDNINLDRLRERITDFLCQTVGGPCQYKGRDMYATHKGLHLVDRQFNALAEDLQTAMEKSNIPYRAQNRLLALLAPMEHQIVTR